MEHNIVETTMIESQISIPDKIEQVSMKPQVAIPEQDTFESIIVNENIVEESESTFEGVFKPQTQKADIDIQKVTSLQVSETITEDKESVFDVVPKREVKATQDMNLHETVIGSLVESVQSIQEIHEEKRISSQATMAQTEIETAVKIETTVSEREGTFEEKDFKLEQQKGKPQMEGLSTVIVTEIISNEIEDILPVTVIPKEQQAQPILTGREVPEITQVIAASTTEEFEKVTQLKKQQGKIEMEEMSSVTISEVISNETEDIFALKTMPKDQKANFNILGHEIAETSQVISIIETENLTLKRPEEQKGKPKLR
uniref:Novex-3 (Titin isoform) n=1 Tax=Apis cerana TaxID=7461 RepID=V9IED0_APICE